LSDDDGGDPRFRQAARVASTRADSAHTNDAHSCDMEIIRALQAQTNVLKDIAMVQSRILEELSEGQTRILGHVIRAGQAQASGFEAQNQVLRRIGAASQVHDRFLREIALAVGVQEYGLARTRAQSRVSQGIATAARAMAARAQNASGNISRSIQAQERALGVSISSLVFLLC
jgi:hypothetical protein